MKTRSAQMSPVTQSSAFLNAKQRPPVSHAGGAEPRRLINQSAIQANTSLTSVANTQVQLNRAKSLAGKEPLAPISPRPKDILSGRGGYSNQFEGNRIYRALIAQKKLGYISCTTKLDKVGFVQRVIEEIQSYGGRFLEKTNEDWQLMDETKVRGKVAQALREGAPALRNSVTKHPQKPTITNDRGSRKQKSRMECRSENQGSRKSRRIMERLASKNEILTVEPEPLINGVFKFTQSESDLRLADHANELASLFECDRAKDPSLLDPTYDPANDKFL